MSGYILAVLTRPGEDPPPPAPYPANADGSPPAAISVPQAVTAVHRQLEDLADRAHHHRAVLTDTYQLVTGIRSGPAVYGTGSAWPGEAWPGEMWPGSPGPSDPAPAGQICTYLYRSTVPAWS